MHKMSKRLVSLDENAKAYDRRSSSREKDPSVAEKESGWGHFHAFGESARCRIRRKGKRERREFLWSIEFVCKWK